MSHLREKVRRRWFPMFQHDRPLLTRVGEKQGTGTAVITDAPCFLTYANVFNSAGSGAAGVGDVRQGSVTGPIIWGGVAGNIGAGNPAAISAFQPAADSRPWCPNGISVEVNGASTVIVVHYVVVRDVPWMRKRAQFKTYERITSNRRAHKAIYVSEEAEPPPGGGGGGIIVEGAGTPGSGGTGPGGLE